MSQSPWGQGYYKPLLWMNVHLLSFVWKCRVLPLGQTQSGSILIHCLLFRRSIVLYITGQTYLIFQQRNKGYFYGSFTPGTAGDWCVYLLTHTVLKSEGRATSLLFLLQSLSLLVHMEIYWTNCSMVVLKKASTFLIQLCTYANRFHIWNNISLLVLCSRFLISLPSVWTQTSPQTWVCLIWQ